MPQTLWFFIAFVIVLALIGAAAWLVRRFASNSIGSSSNRGRMPQLAVIDAAAVDGRRRLVLVRRDNVEHLLMIGGPTDIVVEPNIVRGIPQRDQAAQRAPAGTELPTRPSPLPDAGWDTETRLDNFDQPEIVPEQRSARLPFSDDVRRPSAATTERRSNDPFAGLTPEALTRESLTCPESRVAPRSERAEPIIPRMPRLSEAPTAPLRPSDPATSAADQNLAEMAQRLEFALRRPGNDLRLDNGAATPKAPTMDRVGATIQPQPGARMPEVDHIPLDVGSAAPTQRTNFENLENEMANLLGRPKPSS